ncbi:hypothetical protein GTQ34_05345 [Muricauda sp. JGD-17]|uniref:Uncharacterized protein n=1 Tax=Flagellimonas ochracea TaxID=2696472 RepID=A0A964TC72_9FLAO|nr:hypothetical protein [Allomuricauda ochracea]NAY91338.1 hypothetical protein [Allomuricauda ochracea]
MKRTISSYLLIALLIFLAIGAIPSGFSLVMDPSGESIGFPPELLDQLQRSPFKDFLIPGFFLITLFGIFPLLAVYGLIVRKEKKWMQKMNPYKDQHWSWTFSYYSGLLLILWINMQLFFGIEFGLLHFAYTMLGILIVFLTHLPSTRRDCSVH